MTKVTGFVAAGFAVIAATFVAIVMLREAGILTETLLP